MKLIYYNHNSHSHTGSMWSQSWQVYHKLLMPGMPIEGDLDLNVQRTQWTSRDMVNRADDFYSSMGLPPMTATFWKKSLFERSNKETHEKCHGTAANMFEPDDYRYIHAFEQSNCIKAWLAILIFFLSGL